MKSHKNNKTYYIGLLAPFWMAFLFFILYKTGIYTIISNFMNKLEENTRTFFISFWNGPYKEPVLIGAAFGFIISALTISLIDIEIDAENEKDDN